MSDITEATAAAKAKLQTLQNDFAQVGRWMENLDKQIESCFADLSSLHKQATNEAKPNPEVNATSQPQPTTTPIPPASSPVNTPTT